MTETILEIDNSTLEGVAKCHTYAALRYVLFYTTRTENQFLKSGNDCHSALEHWFKGGTTEDALQIFDRLYKAWAEAESEIQDRMKWWNVRQVLKQFFDVHVERKFPWQTLFTEKAFSVPLFDGVRLTGLMDIVGRDEQFGGLAPVDHKTTGQMNAMWIKQKKSGSQFTGYIWALGQIFPQEQIFGGYINGLEIKNVPASKKKCTTHSVNYSICGPQHIKFQIILMQRTKEQTERWLRTAWFLVEEFKWMQETVKTIEDIEKVKDQGRFNGSCYFCEFSDFCDQQRRPHLADVLFEKRKWDPTEGRDVLREGMVLG